MAEESIFGTPAHPVSRGGEDDTPSWLQEESITEPAADDAAEGSPAEQPRDEHGRFAAKDAPDATPDPATDQPQEAQETPVPIEVGQDIVVQLTPEEFAQLQAAQAVEGQPAEENVPTGASEEARLYANKYRNVEDLERGYRERSDMWRRAMEAKQAEEAERIRVQQQAEQYEQALRSAVPMLEEAARREQQMRRWAEQYRQETGSYPQGFDPNAAPVLQGPPAGQVDRAGVERILEERLAQERARMAEQFQKEQEAAALERTVNEFYRDHPEVEPYGATDTEITDAMRELNFSPAWRAVPVGDGTFGVEIDPTDRGSLDVLYEAVNRPALLEVLKLRPDYFSSEVGLQLARREAAILEGVPATTEPQTTTVPASRAGTRAGQRVPFAESAQGTVPENAGPDLSDPWERIKAVGATPKGEKKAVFFE